MRVAGMVLVVVGLLAIGLGVLGWTERRTLFDIGQIEAKTEEQKTSPEIAIAGIVATAIGAALVIGAGRKSVA
jgi:hypothetical protein